jgi:hypothetical protein
MFAMFADESGDSGLTNSRSAFFALTGLVVSELRWRACLQPKLQQFLGDRWILFKKLSQPP